MSELATTASVAVLIKQDAVQSRIREVLGERAPQFSSSVVSLWNGSPQLKKCDPNSVIASCMTAALLDLPISKDLGFAWVVPYKDTAQFQMGAKGFIQLALRTGQYARMNAEGINADAFNGYDEVGEPKIDWSAFDSSKPIVGFVFAFKLVNGFSKTLYWSRERCLSHAQRYSKAFKSNYETPWKSHENEMCLKTVVKYGLRAWGILSIEMQKALREDQGVRKSVTDDFNSAPDYIDAEAKDKPEVSDAARSIVDGEQNA